MKNVILILVILIFPRLCFSQSDVFEGEIKYEVTYAGADSDGLNSIGFTGYHYYFGSSKIRLSLSGGLGMFLNDFIIDRQSGETVMVDDYNETVYTIDADKEKDTAVISDKKRVVVKTKTKAKIMGYKCTKYMVSVKTDSTEIDYEYWTTTKIKVNSDANFELISGLTCPGVEGFPLRIVSSTEGVSVTQEVTYLRNDPPEKAKFEIPSTYVVKDFSESPVMQLANEFE